jgi:hypothetical protein
LAIYFNDSISGNGSADLTGGQVQYLLFHATTLGPDVFVSDPNNIDLLLHAGWISFGVDEAYPDATRRVFWTERIWLNFADFEWHPRPSNHPGDTPDFTVWASHVRWSLSLGTAGNLLVVGI